MPGIERTTWFQDKACALAGMAAAAVIAAAIAMRRLT
jgi:hypothetical protein